MKKSSFLPSILVILTIMTLGLTSCSRKYGCYYSQTTELKTRQVVQETNSNSTTGARSLNDQCTAAE